MCGLYEKNGLNYVKEYDSYDAVNKQWLYSNKPIRYLSDGNKNIHVDNSENAVKYCVLLEVVRNANGKINKLVEIAKAELD